MIKTRSLRTGFFMLDYLLDDKRHHHDKATGNDIEPQKGHFRH